MATVIIGIATTSTPSTTGAALAGILISLGAGINPVHLPAGGPYSATFDGVADGSYTATAQGVDASGNAVTAAITAQVLVQTPPPAPAPTPAPVMVDAPTSLTVSVTY